MHQTLNQGAPLLAESLKEARLLALQLFEAIAHYDFIQPGRTEQEINDAIQELALRQFNIQKHWHKRIVRAGVNTLCQFDEDPPVATVADDDLVFIDLGPVFANFEADFGRTYVIGDNPQKHRLVRDLENIFDTAKLHYFSNPHITGGELYRFLTEQAEALGWSFGADYAGHILGEFPHKQIHGKGIENYIHAENTSVLSQTNAEGKPRHWILEVHLVDRHNRFGGFYEDFLDINL